MLIQATDAQVIEMGQLAVLASEPVGLGILHYQPSLLKESVILEPKTRGLFIDYYQGRMVKFSGWRMDDGWEFPDSISPEYESWIRKYPSYCALFEAATAQEQEPT